MPSPLFIVGLTGGIGSGKSAAAECFVALGAACVDTDVIAHELTAKGGAAIEPLVAAFGSTALTPDGTLDRAAMRQRVFAAPGERKKLEAILHPLILAECERRVDRLASPGKEIFSAHADPPYVVLVVPLLVETGAYRERINRAAVVDCPDEIRMARVMARSALSRDEVQAIMASQASRTERLACADDTIINDAGLDKLQAQIAALHASYCEFARNFRGS